MPIANRRYFILSLLLAALILLFDQGSKWLLLTMMRSHDYLSVKITSFFNLALVWNTGISFGLFSSEHQPIPLIVLSLVIICILLKWLYKNTSRQAALALGCVIGGALGNVIDRVRFRAVSDFFDLHIGPYHWPAFNIADSAILIGVVLLSLGSIMHPLSRQNGAGNDRNML